MKQFDTTSSLKKNAKSSLVAGLSITKKVKRGLKLADEIKKAQKVAKAKKANKACNCFTAGTKVLTDEGEKPIEDIKVGDMVLAKSDETGEVAYKEVVGLFQKQADEIYSIYVGDEVIEATAEHPFWLSGRGWTDVKDLKVGDLLVTSSGITLAIDKIEKELLEATVYNFEVADFQSYFVSNLEVWVHNCNILKYHNDFMGHIFHGRLDGKKVSGYHHKNINSPYTLSNVSSKNKFGVYEATVSYKGMSKKSTFFPDSWNRTDVLNSIKDAYGGLSWIKKNSWNTGTTSKGMKIRMFINSAGKMETAHPIK